MTNTTLDITNIWRECKLVIRNPEMRERTCWDGPQVQLEPGEGAIQVWLPDMQRNAVVPTALDRRELARTDRIRRVRRVMSENERRASGGMAEAGARRCDLVSDVFQYM